MTQFKCKHCSRPMEVNFLEYSSNSYCNVCFDERASKNIDERRLNTFEFMGDVISLEQETTSSQTEKMYSEEEVIRILDKREDYLGTQPSIFDYLTNKEWFEQFKKK